MVPCGAFEKIMDARVGDKKLPVWTIVDESSKLEFLMDDCLSSDLQT